MADSAPITDTDREELVAFLDGELDADGLQRVERRLSLDPTAREEADALKRTWDLLDYLPRPEPSPEFTTRTLDAISGLRPAAWKAWAVTTSARYGAWAAAVVAAVALGYLVPLRKAPPPAPPVELEADPLYVNDPRVIEHLELFLAVDNLAFLRSLDTENLFGEDALGR